jgi:hypothetical protein
VTGVDVTAPFFETATLIRRSGSRTRSCGTISLPVVVENGAARSWQYRMGRPATGPCGDAEFGDFEVIGTRAGREYRTARAP